MTDILSLPNPEPPRRKVMKRWKWIALAAFALALLLAPWLPSAVRVLCTLAGVAAIANLLFHAVRRLRDRLFWKVRNRILGSFIFAGFIPLLLILTAVTLIGYMALGQLAASYLQSSLDGFARELTQIGTALSVSLPREAGATNFESIAARVFSGTRAAFPRLAAMVVRLRENQSPEVVAVHDPDGLAFPLDRLPAGGLYGDGAYYEGLWELPRQGVALVSLIPISGERARYLAVAAPMDEQMQNRLERERGLYAAFIPTAGRGVNVNRDSDGVRVEDTAGNRDSVAEEGVRAMTERSQRDPRRMIWWFSVLEGWNEGSGKREEVMVAVMRVPLQSLYQSYFAGYSKTGEVLLYASGVLLGLFLAAQLVSMITGLAISRRITRSVHDMHQGILALKKGDLEHRIPVRRQDQLGLLSDAFNQMAGSITRLLEEVSEKKRLEQELQIAREVQTTLFPKHLPQPRGLALFGGCQPAQVVSGDYYDFIVEDETHLYIVIADISGKGISAALLMANLQAVMRNQLLGVHRGSTEELERGLAAVMTELNRQVYLNSPAEKYATLFLGRYDAESRRLCYSNAGHLPPIVLRGNEVRRLEAGGTVIGLFEEMDYEAQTVNLRPGSVLALFTDGITEAANGQDEEYGEERLIHMIRICQSQPPEVIYAEVVREVHNWQGGLKQQDDITLIVGKVD